jgi:hypothetical protein
MTASSISQRQILAFWLPLAASWALMGLEGPILQAAIARLADLETQLAAFGIVMSVEIAIESPVIMLLSTSTALVTSAQSYNTMRRFVIWVNLLVTVVAFLVAFTPVYHWVVFTVMGIPAHIAQAAQPGMKIMTFWSAAIGVRRFLQGVLIRQGETRWIGYGTLLRLITSGGTAILLAIVTQLPGVYIASTGLMAGVTGEALFIIWAARPRLPGFSRNLIIRPAIPFQSRISPGITRPWPAPLFSHYCFNPSLAPDLRECLSPNRTWRHGR